MDKRYLSIEELKINYPNEWILLGNPIFEKSKVVGEIPLFHSFDKKEVCYIGKDKVSEFDTVTITFVGEPAQIRKLGILQRI